METNINKKNKELNNKSNSNTERSNILSSQRNKLHLDPTLINNNNDISNLKDNDDNNDNNDEIDELSHYSQIPSSTKRRSMLNPNFGSKRITPKISNPNKDYDNKFTSNLVSNYNYTNGRDLIEDIIQKTLHNDCYVIQYGYQNKLNDFYFCYTCDPESKMPFCPNCLVNCHNFNETTSIKHEISNKISLNQICYCGFSNHNLNKNNVDREYETASTCILSEWHSILNIPMYKGKKNESLCFYCYEVCSNYTNYNSAAYSKTFCGSNDKSIKSKSRRSKKPEVINNNEELAKKKNSITNLKINLDNNPQNNSKKFDKKYKTIAKVSDVNNEINNNNNNENNDISDDSNDTYLENNEELGNDDSSEYYNEEEDENKDYMNIKCFCNSSHHLDRISLDLIKQTQKISLFKSHKIQLYNLIFINPLIVKQVYKKLFRKIERMNRDLNESDYPISSIDKDLIVQLQRLNNLFSIEHFKNNNIDVKIEYNSFYSNRVDQIFNQYFNIEKLISESFNLDFIFLAIERDFDTKSNYVWSFKQELVNIFVKVFVEELIENNFEKLNLYSVKEDLDDTIKQKNTENNFSNNNYNNTDSDYLEYNFNKNNFLNRDMIIEDMTNFNPYFRCHLHKQNLRKFEYLVKELSFNSNLNELDENIKPTKNNDYVEDDVFLSKIEKVKNILFRSRLLKYRGYSCNEIINKLLCFIRIYLNIKTSNLSSKLSILSHLYLSIFKFLKYGYLNHENIDTLIKWTDDLLFYKLLQDFNESKLINMNLSFSDEIKNLYNYIFKVYSEFLILVCYQYNDEVILTKIKNKCNDNDSDTELQFIQNSEFGESVMKSTLLCSQVLEIVKNSVTLLNGNINDDKLNLSKKYTNLSTQNLNNTNNNINNANYNTVNTATTINNYNNKAIVFPVIKSETTNYSETLIDENVASNNFKDILNMSFSDALDLYSHNLFSMIQENYLEHYFEILVIDQYSTRERLLELFLNKNEQKLERLYYQIFNFKIQSIEKLEIYVYRSITDVINELRLEKYKYKQYPLNYSPFNFVSKPNNNASINLRDIRDGRDKQDINNEIINGNTYNSKNIDQQSVQNNILNNKKLLSNRLSILKLSKTYLANSFENLLANTNNHLDNEMTSDKIQLSKKLVSNKKDIDHNNNECEKDSKNNEIISDLRKKIVLSKSNYLLCLLKSFRIIKTLHDHKVVVQDKSKSKGKNYKKRNSILSNLNNNSNDNNINITSPLKDKLFNNSSIKEHISNGVLKILYYFIENNPSNCLIILSTPFLNSIKCCGLENITKMLELILNTLKTIGNATPVTSLKSLNIFLNDIIENVNLGKFHLEASLLVIQILQQMMNLNYCNKSLEINKIRNHLKRLYLLNINIFKVFINVFKASEIRNNFNSNNNYNKDGKNQSTNVLFSLNNNNNNNFLNSNNIESLSPDNITSIANNNTNNILNYKTSFVNKKQKDNNNNNNNNNNPVTPISQIYQANTINPDGVNPSTIQNNPNNASYSLFIEKNLRNLYFIDKITADIRFETIEALIFNLFYLLNNIYETNTLLKHEDNDFILSLPDINESILIIRKKGLDLAIRTEVLKFIKIFHVDISFNDMRIVDYNSVIVNKITFENDFISTCLNNFAQSNARNSFLQSLENRVNLGGSVMNDNEEYTLINNFYTHLSEIGYNKPNEVENNLVKYELLHCLKMIYYISSNDENCDNNNNIDFFLNDYVLESLIPLINVICRKMFLVLKYSSGREFIKFYEIMKIIVKIKINFLYLIIKSNNLRIKIMKSLIFNIDEEIKQTKDDYESIVSEEFDEFDFCLVDNYIHKHLLFFKDFSYKLKKLNYNRNMLDQNNNLMIPFKSPENSSSLIGNKHNISKDEMFGSLIKQIKQQSLYSKKQTNFSLMKSFLKKKPDELLSIYDKAYKQLSKIIKSKEFYYSKTGTAIVLKDAFNIKSNNNIYNSNFNNDETETYINASHLEKLSYNIPTNNFFLNFYYKYSLLKNTEFSETSIFRVFDKKLSKETTYLDFLTNYCCSNFHKEYNSEILWITFRILQSCTIEAQDSFCKISNLITHLEFLVKLFIQNLISLLFNCMNDCYLSSLNSDYQFAFNIIKVFKYLCEEHNIQFQEVFFKEIHVTYQKLIEKKLPNSVRNNININNKNDNDNYNNMNYSNLAATLSNHGANTLSVKKIKKISLFDFLLCSLCKLILICEWKSYYTQIDYNKSIKEKYSGGGNESNLSFSHGNIKNKIGKSKVNDVINIKANSRSNKDDKDDKDKKENKKNTKIDIIDTINEFFNSNTINSDYENNSSVYYYDLIFAICELCIEMVQGTSVSNLNSLIKESESSKIFVNFITEIKGLLLSECYYTIDNDILVETQKNLFNLVISFIEEKNTPKEIVVLIAQNLSPTEVIRTINLIMNFLYEKVTNYNNNSESCQDNINDMSNSYNSFLYNSNSSNISSNNISNSNDTASKYSNMFFNEKKKNFFHYKYFSNLEFINDYPIMEIANRMFQYLTLLAEEHKIDIAQEILSGKNNSSNFFFYLISFFSNINKIVEIEQNNDIYRVIYIVHPLTLYLSDNTKIDFEYSVDRSNRYTKLISLLDSCEFFFEEVQHNYSYTQKNFLFFYINKVNYYYIEYLCFFLSFVINVIMIISMKRNKTEEESTPDHTSDEGTSNITERILFNEEDNLSYDSFYINNTILEQDISAYTETYYASRMLKSNLTTTEYLHNTGTYADNLTTISNSTNLNSLQMNYNDTLFTFSGNDISISDSIFGLAIIIVTVSVTTCIMWLISKYKLNYVIEKKRIELNSKKQKIKELSLTKYYFSMIIDEIVFIYNCTIRKNQINCFLWYIIFSLIAINNRPHNYYLFSLQMLIFFNISSTLKTVIYAHIISYKQLLAIFLLISLFLYLITSIYFFLIDTRDFFGILKVNDEHIIENFCGTFISCYLYIHDYGIRLDTNVGEFPNTKTLFSDTGYYILRTLARIFYFVSIVMVLLSLFFGIIVQSFSDLRVQNSKEDQDREEVCFICGATKDQIQKQNQNYNTHRKEVHNLWVYVNYIIGLKFEDPQETNAINSEVIDMLQKRQIGWFPMSYNNNGDKEKEENSKSLFNLNDAEVKIIDEDDEENDNDNK